MATEAPKATETVVSTGVTPAVAVEKVEEKKVEEWKPRISVFNLPAGVTSQDELRELCKPFGTITNVEFVPAKGNRNAFGFVTFKTKGDAEYAIYRLNEENFGGKVPVRAKWPPEKDASKQKEESGADGKPKKNKKPMTSLSLLTPKNVASNAQHQNAAPLNKKGWDIPAQGQNNQQGQKKQYQQVQQGGDNSQNQNQYPKGPRGKKGGPNQGRPQGQPGGQQQQQGGNPKPVHQPRPNQGGQQAGGQHPNQPHPNQGGPKGKKNQGQQNDASVPQQNQPQNSQPAHPQQNQQPRGKAPQQNQQQVHHEAAPQQNPPQQNNAQQQNPQQPRNPRKKQPKKAYVVTVADGKTGLPLHVINLSKPQFDQYIGPLVVKPAPQ